MFITVSKYRINTDNIWYYSDTTTETGVATVIRFCDGGSAGSTLVLYGVRSSEIDSLLK